MSRFSLLFLLIILHYSLAYGQVCQGSLGDPIVNITFGAGPNPGAPLSSSITAYSYVGNDCPGDGFYSIRNRTSSCFSNSWFTLNTDHTGDLNGYFMLVNASFSPSPFFVDTIRGLCPSTTYEFASWIVNVSTNRSNCGPPYIQPNLTFRIEKLDGTLLKSYQSGEIFPNGGLWQQYGAFFQTPNTASDVVFKIFNNAPGGCGNDLALDDITFRACGPQLTPFVVGGASTLLNACAGVAAKYTFTFNISPAFMLPFYQWQQRTNNGGWQDIAGANGDTLLNNLPATAAAGKYEFRLSAAEAANTYSPNCKVVSSPIVVMVKPPLATSSTNSGSVCEGRSVALSAAGGVQYGWTGPNNFVAQGATAKLSNPQQSASGKYFVLVTDNDGCTNMDSTSVVVHPLPVVVTGFSSQLLCKGDSLSLSSSGGTGYSWQPTYALSDSAIANPMAAPQVSTKYTVVVTTEFACIDSAVVDIMVVEKPQANAGPDKVVAQGTTVPLLGTASGGTIAWTPATWYIDNPLLAQPIVRPPADTAYVLTVTAANGCGVASDTVRVFIFKALAIASAFSPNGDGLNDTWNIGALSMFSTFELSVFNRYGQIVFQTKNVAKPWDGKFKGQSLPAGSYVYFIKFNQYPYSIKGNLTIIQ